MSNPRAKFEAGEPASEEELTAVESRLGWELPGELKSLAGDLGDAFVGGSLDGNDRYSVLCYLDLRDCAAAKDWLSNEYIEEGILPFARCELGGLYLLEESGQIWFRWAYSGETILETVADSYADFEQRIIIRELDS